MLLGSEIACSSGKQPEVCISILQVEAAGGAVAKLLMSMMNDVVDVVDMWSFCVDVVNSPRPVLGQSPVCA